MLDGFDFQVGAVNHGWDSTAKEKYSDWHKSNPVERNHPELLAQLAPISTPDPSEDFLPR
jgi:hypothetical protein